MDNAPHGKPKNYERNSNKWNSAEIGKYTLRKILSDPVHGPGW